VKTISLQLDQLHRHGELKRAVSWPTLYWYYYYYYYNFSFNRLLFQIYSMFDHNHQKRIVGDNRGTLLQARFPLQPNQLCHSTEEKNNKHP